jgi:hypothetical protein
MAENPAKDRIVDTLILLFVIVMVGLLGVQFAGDVMELISN